MECRKWNDEMKLCWVKNCGLWCGKYTGTEKKRKEKIGR